MQTTNNEDNHGDGRITTMMNPNIELSRNPFISSDLTGSVSLDSLLPTNNFANSEVAIIPKEEVNDEQLLLQQMYYTSNISPTLGGYTTMFYAVTAAVIGGTAMLGGVGTIIGAFFGAVVLGILLDGFPLVGVSADPLGIIFGGAILVAMVANVQLTRLRDRGQR